MTKRTLRTGRLRWLARYFEEHPKEYDQGTFCGTAMCVGGLAVWQWGTDAQRTEMDRHIRGKGDCPTGVGPQARWVLGLAEHQAIPLFLASPSWLNNTDTTAKKAERVAVVLRHLAATGEVLGEESA